MLLFDRNGLADAKDAQLVHAQRKSLQKEWSDFVEKSDLRLRRKVNAY